jgi:hypothetical protein
MKAMIHFWLCLAAPALSFSMGLTALGYDNAQLRADLQSDDPRVYKQATLKAVEMPTPETVRDLMAIVLSKDLKARARVGDSDVLYAAPRMYALVALARMLPNPPATFSKGGIGGGEVFYFELWEAWWEENHLLFEGKEARMPEVRPDSLRNLSDAERAAVENENARKASELYRLLTRRQIRSSGSTWDEIEDEYLEERRQARAAERALAKQDSKPGESGITSPVGTNPPGASSASDATSPAVLAWIFTLGFLALIAAVTVALRLRSKHADASA